MSQAEDVADQVSSSPRETHTSNGHTTRQGGGRFPQFLENPRLNALLGAKGRMILRYMLDYKLLFCFKFGQV